MKAQFAFNLFMLTTSVPTSNISPAQPVFLNIPSQFDGQHVTPARALPTPSLPDCNRLLQRMSRLQSDNAYLSCSHKPIYSVIYSQAGNN